MAQFNSVARKDWDETWKIFGFASFVKNKVVDTLVLRLNPEEFTQTEPKRVNVTQTKGGAFVEHFGEGLKTITIRGTTGYKPAVVDTGFAETSGGVNVKSREPGSGAYHFFRLRQIIREWATNSKENAEDYELWFSNKADDEIFQVVVTNFALLRAVGRPLLYQYNIQMTVIADIKVKKVSKWDPDENPIGNLVAPAKRLPSVLASIKKNVDFVKNLILKNLSQIPPITDGSMVWGEKISKGAEYDSSGIFKSISGVVSEVEDIGRDVETCVSGATALITRPFEIVQNTAEHLVGAISTMCASANVPHEIIRAFREMYCALKSMPRSLFMGFTNPSLFEGASSCGTTLGIAEASVSGWRNSFSATSMIAVERPVSKVFYAPELSITLPEVPIKIKGVYLLNDAARTGTNYLDSVFGPVVRLTKIPLDPIVIDYSVQQATTTDMIKLKTASGYVVKRGDTPQRIAQSVYGDASRWKDIILYNNLEFPYITDDINTVKEFKAIGVVTFHRLTGIAGDITIPLGHRVYVPKLTASWASQWATEQINFRTTESKLLGIGATSVDVRIEATISGDIGNLAAELITGCDTILVGGISAIDRVTNNQPTGGGKIWRVVEPGDVIQIPKTETDVTSIVVSDKSSYEELFGIDILVDDDGEFAKGSEGDIGRVFGTKNLVQALRNRIYTNIGYYPYYPEYGCGIDHFIGQKMTDYEVSWIKALIIKACVSDPRIKSLKDFLMEASGDSISVNFDAIPIDEQIGIPVNLII